MRLSKYESNCALVIFNLRDVLSHERIHVRQVERWGPLFLPAYVLASVVAQARGLDAYRDNPFEREAFDDDAQRAREAGRHG